MTQKQKTGQQGEQIAANYLQQHGYEILARNWHCPYGEIDIIARHHQTLVFVEVKTRRGRHNALASITPGKRQRLVASVHIYLNRAQLADAVWRIDAIAITLTAGNPPQIDHVQDVLDW
jgi:putative endonuclease